MSSAGWNMGVLEKNSGRHASCGSSSSLALLLLFVFPAAAAATAADPAAATCEA